MNETIVENMLTWFFFALASTCTLSFASRIYDDFIGRKRARREKKAIAKIALLSDPRPDQLGPEKLVIRGYDSPELFREDLWIRRIEQSRREHAALAASMPQVKASLGAFKEYPKQLCAMLAQHARTRAR